MSKKTKVFFAVGGIAVLYEFLAKPVSSNFGIVLPDIDYSSIYDFMSGKF